MLVASFFAIPIAREAVMEVVVVVVAIGLSLLVIWDHVVCAFLHVVIGLGLVRDLHGWVIFVVNLIRDDVFATIGVIIFFICSMRSSPPTIFILWGCLCGLCSTLFACFGDGLCGIHGFCNEAYFMLLGGQSLRCGSLSGGAL